MEALAKTGHLTAQSRHVIDDDSRIGEARRAAQTLANFELDAQAAGKAAIVATELATNLMRHAGGGELLMQTLGNDGDTVVELLAIDRGPGMHDVARCLTDGYSTGGTAGTGLGAVRRLSDEFDIYSMPGEGTVVMARFGKPLRTRFGAICVPLPGEIDCGDAWHLVSEQGRTALMLVDGLGHGTFAAEASQAGIGAFAASPWSPPVAALDVSSRLMSKTRGGAAACALVDGESVSYAGVGNISGVIIGPEKSQGMVSQAGTMGTPHRRPQQFEYRRAPGSLLVMHSDGLSARWNLREKPGLLVAHPALVAAVLYRDHGRNRDDATVVVLA
jgi:anti-sigma regulatory factor (Ser/Thr protein kinase)